MVPLNWFFLGSLYRGAGSGSDSWLLELSQWGVGSHDSLCGVWGTTAQQRQLRMRDPLDRSLRALYFFSRQVDLGGVVMDKDLPPGPPRGYWSILGLGWSVGVVCRGVDAEWEGGFPH